MDIPLHVTTTDLDTMRRAVLIDPGDDLARLAFADACEEAGELGLAEFVRVQVALSKPCPLGYSDSYHVDGVCRVCDPLDARQRELLMTLPKDPLTAACDKVKYVRGLVESVALPLAAFMQHAGSLFSRHPIVSVTITDKEPSLLSSGAAGWLTCGWPGCDTPTCLPPALFSLLDGESAGANYKRFDTPALVHAALSAACVAYGRALAGLPALPVHPPADTGGHGGGSPVAGAVQPL